MTDCVPAVAEQSSIPKQRHPAVGSPTVAKKVKQAGGTAVIMLEQNDVGAGSSGAGSVAGGWGSLFSMGGTKTTTTFVVVKYLD